QRLLIYQPVMKLSTINPMFFHFYEKNGTKLSSITQLLHYMSSINIIVRWHYVFQFKDSL
ncbi:hypothetical protein DQM06_09550, partial [Lactiplantibacillus plantarum]